MQKWYKNGGCPERQNTNVQAACKCDELDTQQKGNYFKIKGLGKIPYL